MSLRILHVVPYFEDAWAYGGIPRVAAAMTSALARRGHAVTVCTTDACDADARLPSDKQSGSMGGVTVRVFPNISNRLAYHYQFFTPLGLDAFLKRQAHQFDVAHLHACRNLPGLAAARHLARAGVPYVLSPNGTAPRIERRLLAKRLFDTLGGRRVMERAARVVAVTEAERAQLISLGVRSERIAIVPNPIDESEFRAAPDRNDCRRALGFGCEPVVLFLGKLTPRKGVDVLIRAVPYIKASSAQIVIAGNDMGSGRAIDNLISRMQLEGRVKRLGLLRGRDRLHALAAADVAVYPSRDEVFGLVPIEALLLGTPVVVCNDSGCGEVIAGLHGGLLVPWGDAQRLAAAIDDILATPAEWRTRARTAGERARQQFGSAAVSARLEALYATLVGHAPAPAGAVH